MHASEALLRTSGAVHGRAAALCVNVTVHACAQPPHPWVRSIQGLAVHVGACSQLEGISQMRHWQLVEMAHARVAEIWVPSPQKAEQLSRKGRGAQRGRMAKDLRA